jgi:DNA-binding GntR family transcriptional regulator
MFKSGRVASLHAAAAEFHATLVAASGSETLVDTLRPLIARSQFYFPYSTKRTAQSQREHQRMIDALRLRDAATAKRILAEHMNVNIELLRKAARDAAKPSTAGGSASTKAGTIRLGARKMRQ